MSPLYILLVQTLLINKHFPKCFNRKKVKATYCTLLNMMEKIGNLNAKILSKDKEKEKEAEVIMKNGKPKACCRDQEYCTLKPDG